jgi:hypothetical protein
MAVDPTVLSQLDTAHARGVAMAGAFAEQHAMMIIAGAQTDARLMNGFLAGQLFDQQTEQAKTAYHTPVEPAAAPLPASVAK